MRRYRPGNVPITDLPNTQRWLRSELERVSQTTDDLYDVIQRLAQRIVELFVVAGYGGISDSQSRAITIGAAYQTVDFDQAIVAIPRGVEQRFTTNSLVFEAEGLWQVSVRTNLAGYAEANDGRTIYIRMRNATKDYNTNPMPIGIGRNQNDTNITVSSLVDIQVDELEDEWQVQIGGGDTVAGGTIGGSEFSVFHVSEYKGDLSLEIQAR